MQNRWAKGSVSVPSYLVLLVDFGNPKQFGLHFLFGIQYLNDTAESIDYNGHDVPL